MKNQKKELATIPQANAILANVVQELTRKTPAEFIKRRPDGYSYVEIGYIKMRLNQIFTPILWSHTVEEIGEIEDWLKIGQITVKVKLKVKLPYNDGWLNIVKNGYGGARIQRRRDNNEVMDLGNDLKSAEADGLKKAASNFNIAFDVFHPKVITDVQKVKARTNYVQPTNDTRKNYYLRGIFAMAKELWGLTDKEEIKKKIIEELKLNIGNFRLSEAKEEFLQDIFDKMQILQHIPKRKN